MINIFSYCILSYGILSCGILSYGIPTKLLNFPNIPMFRTTFTTEIYWRLGYTRGVMHDAKVIRFFNVGASRRTFQTPKLHYQLIICLLFIVIKNTKISTKTTQCFYP